MSSPGSSIPPRPALVQATTRRKPPETETKLDRAASRTVAKSPQTVCLQRFPHHSCHHFFQHYEVSLSIVILVHTACTRALALSPWTIATQGTMRTRTHGAVNSVAELLQPGSSKTSCWVSRVALVKGGLLHARVILRPIQGLPCLNSRLGVRSLSSPARRLLLIMHAMVVENPVRIDGCASAHHGWR
jgi:hypothetical protein